VTIRTYQLQSLKNTTNHLEETPLVFLKLSFQMSNHWIKIILIILF